MRTTFNKTVTHYAARIHVTLSQFLINGKNNKLILLIISYSWWQIPYYWAGIKCYDLVAGDRNVKSSYYLSKSDALERFPMLKGDALKGAIVYYDGKQIYTVYTFQTVID